MKAFSFVILVAALSLPPAALAAGPGWRGASVAQQRQDAVVGVVSDRHGPVVGAAVLVRGTTNGAVTDADGRFSLDGVRRGDVLVVSFIGYVSQEVAYDGQASIDVTLVDEAQEMGEVVVVGYGTQRRANLTGAVEQVGGDVLESRPISNIGQGLQGVIPNLNVTPGGGAPGQAASYNVRGTTSLNGGGPLVLVDNVQMDANLVNPDDVASITVLKDAASAAIYGARAAYGVILITTKQGRKDSRPRVSLNASGYWQSPAVRVSNVSSMEYLTMIDIAYQNSGGSGHLFDSRIYDYAERYANGTFPYAEFFVEDSNLSLNQWQYVGNTDWFKELYKTSFSQVYNLSMSGGSERITYYASVGFNDQGGMLRAGDDFYRKFNANVNVSADVTRWLNVSGKVMHTYTKERHPLGGTTSMNATAYSGLSAYSGQLKNDLSPLMPVRHTHTGRLARQEGAAPIDDAALGIVTQGNYVYVDEGVHYFAGQGSYTNPVAIQEQGGNGNYKTNDLWLTGAARVTPVEGLAVNADYTFNFYNRGTKQHVMNFYDYRAVAGAEGYYPWTNPSSVTLTNAEDYYTALNAYAEYQKTVDDTHSFKILVGYNQEYKHTKSFWVGRRDLIVNSMPVLTLATGDRNQDYSESHWAVQGAFARVNYDFAQRYLLELNGRYDGSSKFPSGDRFAFFPSVSAGWRISEEGFFDGARDGGLFSNLKVRASYGSLGNQNVSGNFPYLASYGVSASYGMLLGGEKPVAISAPGLVSGSLTWEKVTQVDVGLDATMLDDRLNVSFDWYRRDTRDMLTAGQSLPAVLGTGVPVENAADLKTVGWELTLGWNDRFDNGLSYHVKGVLSDYQSEITKFTNDAGLISSNYVGKKIGEIWGYTSNGLFQSQQEVSAHASQAQVWGGSWGPGDVKYEDLNGDGVIGYGNNTLQDHGDLSVIGNDTPRFSYGVTAGLEWKGVDFEMFWQGIGKRDFMPSGSAFWGFTSRWDTPLKPALDYWTPSNTGAYFPRPGWQNSGNRQTSTRYLQSAAYCRLKNVVLGYTFPFEGLRKAGVDRLRVYVQGENLLTMTKLIESYDPETINNMTYPIARKVSVGLNLTF